MTISVKMPVQTFGAPLAMQFLPRAGASSALGTGRDGGSGGSAGSLKAARSHHLAGSPLPGHGAHCSGTTHPEH